MNKFYGLTDCAKKYFKKSKYSDPIDCGVFETDFFNSLSTDTNSCRMYNFVNGIAHYMNYKNYFNGSDKVLITNILNKKEYFTKNNLISTTGIKKILKLCDEYSKNRSKQIKLFEIEYEKELIKKEFID